EREVVRLGLDASSAGAGDEKQAATPRARNHAADAAERLNEQRRQETDAAIDAMPRTVRDALRRDAAAELATHGDPQLMQPAHRENLVRQLMITLVLEGRFTERGRAG